MYNMQKWKWITFDISDWRSSKEASCGLLLCSYGALLCVQCVWGWESHEYLQGGGGVVDENGGMVGGRKSPYTPSIRPYTRSIRPYTSEYTAVYFEV